MDFKKLKCKLSRKKYFQYAIQQLGKPIIPALRRHRRECDYLVVDIVADIAYDALAHGYDEV